MELEESSLKYALNGVRLRVKNFKRLPKEKKPTAVFQGEKIVAVGRVLSLDFDNPENEIFAPNKVFRRLWD